MGAIPIPLTLDPAISPGSLTENLISGSPLGRTSSVEYQRFSFLRTNADIFPSGLRKDPAIAPELLMAKPRENPDSSDTGFFFDSELDELFSLRSVSGFFLQERATSVT